MERGEATYYYLCTRALYSSTAIIFAWVIASTGAAGVGKTTVETVGGVMYAAGGLLATCWIVLTYVSCAADAYKLHRQTTVDSCAAIETPLLPAEGDGAGL